MFLNYLEQKFEKVGILKDCVSKIILAKSKFSFIKHLKKFFAVDEYLLVPWGNHLSFSLTNKRGEWQNGDCYTRVRDSKPIQNQIHFPISFKNILLFLLLLFFAVSCGSGGGTGSTSSQPQPNPAPSINPQTTQYVKAGTIFQTNVEANGFDTPVFALLVSPVGGLISDTGLISWLPTQNDVGSSTFVVQVKDQSDSAEAFDTFLVEVFSTTIVGTGLVTPDTSAYVVVSDTSSSILGISLYFPIGAVRSTVEVGISEIENPPHIDSGSVVVEFGPSGLTFDTPVYIIYNYTDTYLAAQGITDEDSLAFYTWADTEQEWQLLPIVSRDPINNVVIAKTSHFSQFLPEISGDADVLFKANLIQPYEMSALKGSMDSFWDGSGKNLLLIHGITSSHRTFLKGETDKGLFPLLYDYYDNIVYYDYPSGKSILDSSKWLYNRFKYNASAGFTTDIIAHSMGGLVARAALEIHDANDNSYDMLADVSHLVTLGTPHEGMNWLSEFLATLESLLGARDENTREDVYNDYPSFKEMNSQDATFIGFKLKGGDGLKGGYPGILPSKFASKYYFFAGSPSEDDDDGYVEVTSATASHLMGDFKVQTITDSGARHRNLMNIADVYINDLREYLGITPLFRELPNHAPVILSTTSFVDKVVNGDIEIMVKLKDQDGDRLKVEFEYSTDGFTYQPITNRNLTANFENITGHRLLGIFQYQYPQVKAIWGTRLDELGLSGAVNTTLRITVTDHKGKTDVEALTVRIDNSPGTGTVTGRITPLGPADVRGAIVRLYDGSGANGYREFTVVSSSGDFHFENIVPGSYILTASITMGSIEYFHSANLAVVNNLVTSVPIRLSVVNNSSSLPQFSNVEVADLGDGTARITGTVTDVLAKEIILVHNGLSQKITIETDGSFNQILILTSGQNTFKLFAENSKGTSEYTPSPITYTPSAEVLFHVELSWNTNFNDIDLHIWDPNSVHAYYGDTDAIPNAELDHDDTYGYGPENFRIRQLVDGDYEIAVNYFEIHELTLPNSIATVRIILNEGQPNQQIQTFQYELSVPSGNTGTVETNNSWWRVARIRSQSGQLTILTPDTNRGLLSAPRFAAPKLSQDGSESKRKSKGS